MVTDYGISHAAHHHNTIDAIPSSMRGSPGNSVTGARGIPPQALAQWGYVGKYWSRQGTPGNAKEDIMVSYAVTHAVSAVWRCHSRCPLTQYYSVYYELHQQFMAAHKFNVA